MTYAKMRKDALTPFRVLTSLRACIKSKELKENRKERKVTNHSVMVFNPLIFMKLDCDAFMHRSAIHKGIVLHNNNNL